MSDNRVKIADANRDQLLAFANTHLGMNLPGNTLEDTVRARITAAWDKDYIDLGSGESVAAASTQASNSDVVQDSETPPQEPLPVTDAQKDPDREYVRVHLMVTDEAGGSDAVQVGVNGKVMLVPRGEDVDIPVEYFHVLQNAVEHRYDPLPDGGINPVPRVVPKYPFQKVA